MARATTGKSCPRCNSEHTTLKNTHTERHGQVVDIDSYECERCSVEFDVRW